MALVECGECGNEVSDTASACPKCGASMTRKDAASCICRLSGIRYRSELVGDRATKMRLGCLYQGALLLIG